MAGVFKSLNLSDVRVSPFRAYKKWYGGSDLYTRYEGIYLSNLKDLGATYPYIQDSDFSTGTDKLKGSVYHSTNHLFYKAFYDNNKATFGSNNINNQDRFLYDFVTTLSIPQQKVGEGILPGSIKLGFNNGKGYLVNSGSISIVDDSNGNLVFESDIDATGSLTGFYNTDGTLINLAQSLKKIDSQYQVYRLQTERLTKYLDTNRNSGSLFNTKQSWNSTTQYFNITPVTSSRGINWYFTGNVSSSAIIIPENEDINHLYNFINTDYSIGFYINLQSESTNQVLLEKKTDLEVVGLDLNGNTMTNSVSRYPFSIVASWNGIDYDIAFKKSNGVDSTVASITSINKNKDYFVWLQRSGSQYTISAELVDTYPTTVFGGFITSQSVVDNLIDTKCGNKGNIFIGSDYNYSNNFQGYLQGLCFYNKAYAAGSPQYNFQLLTAATNTLNVGNAFYKQGLLTLTHPVTYERDQPYTDQYPQNLEYRSTQTIYETEVSCTVSAGEYNFSSNPTLHVYDPREGQFKLRGFTTASDFTPYVTQIGLYDDAGNLLVVGKTSQPIRKSENVDSTFVLKFDR